jgi:hypothetical protein
MSFVHRAAAVSAALVVLLAGAANAAPAGKTLGPLKIAYRYALPHPVTSRYRVPLVTEASNGTVYFVSGTTIYSVANHDATAVAANVGHPVLALAASSTMLAVETASAVVAYDPSTGAQLASWPLKETGSFLPDLDVAGGVVWSLTDEATDESGEEPAVVSELSVGEPAVMITSTAAPVTPVVDAAGDLYFATFAGKLVRETPAGSQSVSSVKKFAFAALAYDGGTLLAEVDGAGRPTDYEINPTTLAVRSTSRGHTGDYFGLADTTIGALSLNIDCGPTAYCSKVTVRRIGLPDKRGDTTSVPFGTAVMGPDPVVLEIPATGHASLVGLK